MKDLEQQIKQITKDMEFLMSKVREYHQMIRTLSVALQHLMEVSELHLTNCQEEVQQAALALALIPEGLREGEQVPEFQLARANKAKIKEQIRKAAES